MIFILIAIVILFALFLFLILSKFRTLKLEYKKLNERFEAIQDLSFTGYFDGNLIDDDIYWSVQLNKIFGMKPDTKINSKTKSFELIHPDDKEDYIKKLQETLKTGVPFEFDYRIITQDKNEIEFLRTNAKVIYDNNNNIIGLRGAVRNLTKKKKIIQELTKSLKQQESLLSNIDDLVFIMDERGYFREYFNHLKIKLFVPPDEFLDKHYTEFLPEFIIDKLTEVVNNINSSEDSGQFEYYIEQEGEIYFYNVRVSKYDNPLNHIKGYIILVRDVTQNKMIENKLYRSEKRFQHLTELLPVAVFEIDADLIIRYVNKKGFEWFGYEEKDLENNISAMEIVAEEEIPKLMSNLEKRLNSEELGPIEYKSRRKNGELFDTLVYATPIVIGNEIRGVRGVLVDITERKKYLEEIEKYTKYEALGILAGGIAHNFKNILAAVTLSIDMIKLKPDSLDKQLERIYLSLEQANALASRFQTFTKSNEPSLSSVNINQVIEDTIDMALSGTSCIVNRRFKQGIKETQADNKQLNEVFLNLLLNAHQAMKESCLITISTDEVEIKNNEIANLSEGEYIKIVISDDGIGMTEEQQKKLFTPFYTTKKEGHGLGLITVFSIIKSHQGAVQVNSTLGVGTSFTIYLPIRENKRKALLEKQKEIELSENKIKVILIDDDKNITETLTEISNEVNKIYLKAFNNPNEGIQYFKLKYNSNPFDVAILDMTLVGYDKSGIDILNLLKEIDPNIKSLVFTGHSSKPIVSNYMDYGFDGQLDKPCRFEQLLIKVNEVYNK